MNPKRVQLFFVLGVLAITLHFTILLGKELYHYLALNQSTAVRITQWEIIPKKNGFALKADYTFQTQEKTWNHSATLNPPYYLNEMAAFSELKKRAKEPWQAYFRKQNPEISALEKSFPSGLLFRWGCCMGVIIYLFFLKTNYKKLLNSY